MEYNLDYFEENIDYDDMTSEKEYQIVAKELPIPYTDWNDSKDVDKRRRELRKIVIKLYESTIHKIYKIWDKNKYIMIIKLIVFIALKNCMQNIALENIYHCHQMITITYFKKFCITEKRIYLI